MVSLRTGVAPAPVCGRIATSQTTIDRGTGRDRVDRSQVTDPFARRATLGRRAACAHFFSPPGVRSPATAAERAEAEPASGGLAPRIVNLAQWPCHLFARLRQQVEVSGDPVLVDLLEELAAYPQQTPAAPPGDTRAVEPAVCVPPAARRPPRHAVVPRHDDGLRHPGRHHAVGARAGDRLPRGRGDRAGAAPDGRRRRAA